MDVIGSVGHRKIISSTAARSMTLQCTYGNGSIWELDKHISHTRGALPKRVLDTTI